MTPPFTKKSNGVESETYVSAQRNTPVGHEVSAADQGVDQGVRVVEIR
jgi:hypothetical protein